MPLGRDLMSTSESASEQLTSDEIEFLLSLGDLELEVFLRALPTDRHRRTAILQLRTYRTPTERATENLYEFVKQAWHVVEPDRDFIDGWHIKAICDHLTGSKQDLLINVPPGHCKSRLCSVFFPAWKWASNPSVRFICASYGQDLSTRDSIDCRSLVESPWYRERWGHAVHLTYDQNQKTKFSTTAHGWRMATSVDGRGTGEHPDYLLVDDPHNVKQAESTLERETCLRWWTDTMSSRGLIRGVRKVVIMQRLHCRDLSGLIIERGGFEHICLPYEYESARMATTSLGWNDPRTIPGEILWPHVPQRMKDEFAKFAPRLKAGQLQQRPVPEGGAFFKRAWFKIVPDLPAEASIAVRYWDTAASEKSGDYSAGVLIASHDGLWYVADVLREQWSIMERNKIIKQQAVMDNKRFRQCKTVIEQEPGGSGLESVEYLIRKLAGFHVRADKVTSAKEIRAQPLADQAESGNVRLVRANWNQAFIDELCVFPAGDHDDQVDAAAGAFTHLERVPKFEAPDFIADENRDHTRHGVHFKKTPRKRF